MQGISGRFRALLVLFLALFCLAYGKKVSVKEVVFDSAVSDIQWLGTDLKVVVVLTTKGRLYRSTNGGDAWKDISDQLKGLKDEQIVVDRLVKSPADPSTIMVAGTGKDQFISSDGAETWKRLRQASKIHTFLFHKKRPKWALLSTWAPECDVKKTEKKSDDDEELGPCMHRLYITKDLGKTFTLVTSYVVQFSWGDTSLGQEDRIYFTHFRLKRGDQPRLYMWSEHVDFAYTDDQGKSTNRLVGQGNKFLISYGFIFVAKLKDHKSQTVNLMVSNDGGKDFRKVQLPQEIDEKSYTVLDTSEGAVMIHVHHASDDAPANVGNVYVSDAQGVRYALSLPNNVRSAHGECEFDKILSLEGVYMANFKDVPRTDSDANSEAASKKAEANKEADALEQQAAGGTQVDRRHTPKSKGKDESVIRTVISFDKGGVWSYLKPPTVDSRGTKIDCPPDRCWLHLHGITNFQNYAPFYSIENAIGIIMGTGNVGPYLRFEPDQTNTYLSRDGGLTWVEAHKGAFIYEFGDHGGLILMADDVRKTKQVVFSWNEGQSWYDFELSDMPLEVDNIVTEPTSTSTKFLLYGTRGDSGVMYHLDFEALGQPLCKGVWAADSVSSDYETWTASDGRGAEKCILGRQVTYTRRKPTSECFNGEKFERPTTKKNCACTEENFECEMGFTRKVGSMECKFADDGTIPIPEQCTASDFFQAVGYRKVIGDMCEGGWQPPLVSVACPANSKMSRGAMSVLGTIFVVSAIMGLVTYLSRSDTFKGYFANYGFDTYGGIQYAAVGMRAPESALDSVGTRFDADFLDGDQDDFEDDAPQLIGYTGQDEDAEDRRPRDAQRRMETASAPVPKLQKPPGAKQEPAEDLDLL